MPTRTSELQTFTDDATIGTETFRAANLPNAQVSDDAYADLNPLPSSTYTSHYLKGVSPVTLPNSGDVLTEVRVLIEAKATGTSPICSFASVCLVKGGTVQVAVEKATGSLTAADVVYTFTFTAANLATLGITSADIGATFGAACAYSSIDALGVNTPFVDKMSIEYDYTEGRPMGWTPWRDGGPVVLSAGRKIINYSQRSFPVPGRGPVRPPRP